MPLPNNYPREGDVSYYDNNSVDPRWGGVTKSGEKFDENKSTVAILPQHWEQYGNRMFFVTDPRTGKTIAAKANDTGGFERKGPRGRVADLSKGASAELFGSAGTRPAYLEAGPSTMGLPGTWQYIARNDPSIALWYRGMRKKYPKLDEDVVVNMLHTPTNNYDYEKAIKAGVRPMWQEEHKEYRWDDMGKGPLHPNKDNRL